MNFPSQFYEHIFAKGEVGQVNHDYDANGNEVFTGISTRTASVNDASWVIWKGVYANVSIGGTSVWQLTHESYLVGVIWTLRAILNFP